MNQIRTAGTGELQQYYQRKVAGDKMLIIHRVYAVVKRGETYDKAYTLALA